MGERTDILFCSLNHVKVLFLFSAFRYLQEYCFAGSKALPACPSDKIVVR
jgi:hypothetical protein